MEFILLIPIALYFGCYIWFKKCPKGGFHLYLPKDASFSTEKCEKCGNEQRILY